ncbi:MAG: hemerythrin family protein [Clostridiales bacterium]|nr:hemerythrin family protein [Clostridiales bacterium]
MIYYTLDLHTHVALLDEQHEEMISRINAVEAIKDEAISDKEAEKILNFLGEYIIKHFGDEEELQRKTGYPHYDWHHSLHQWYIAEFHRMRQEFMKNGPTPEFTRLLDKSMMNWFVKHIINVDVILGKHINQHK